MGNTELKFPYAYDELGNLVSAQSLERGDKLNHNYYIEGIKEDGLPGREKLTPAIGVKKRSYFRRYPSTSKIYTGDRVSVNIKDYNETVLHKLAKQLLLNKQINSIVLPSAYIDMPGHRLKVGETDTFYINRCESEVTDRVEGTGESVKYDIVAYNKLNETLAIEIYVTHGVDKNKREKIRALGKNVIEIDLSDLIPKDGMLPNNIASKVMHRIIYGGQPLGEKTTTWINNTTENRVMAWYDGLINIGVTATDFKFESDGRWFFYAADIRNKLNRCPYHDKLKPLSKNKYERLLTETQCINCVRCVSTEYSPAEKRGTLVCNQSDIPNRAILSLIASYTVGLK